MKFQYILLILSILVFSSCNRKLEKTLKSKDPEFIMQNARDFYEKGKYEYAIQTFDYAKKYVYGTDFAKEADYYTALSNLGFKNYNLSAAQFKQYAMQYPMDSLAQYSQYMAALCYYKSSRPFNLDQKNNLKAIEELQRYIDLFPNSDKIEECNTMIIDLQNQLDKKAYENAYTLYKTAKYRASSVAFDNVLNKFPDSKYKENILWYSFQSKANFAFLSSNAVMEERLNDAVTAYKLFKKNYPQSKYLSDADKLMKKINEEYEILKTYNSKIPNK